MDLGKRIIIMGSSGSGKSTMAKRLGELTGLPVVHIDRFIWKPGWEAAPESEVREKVLSAADGSTWIIDGNNAKTRDYRLERADTVIYLDFNRYACLFRAIKRRIINNGQARYDVGEGCYEKLDFAIIKFILWTYPRARKGVLARLSEIKPPKRVFRLRGAKAVQRFLRDASSFS